jgi:hypothetical protein
MDFLNIIDDQEENINTNDYSVEENIINTENKKIDKCDRYIELIKLMGLNENINYPLVIIISSIIELYTTKPENNTNYQRNIIFRNDITSKKISECIFGEQIKYGVSQMTINRHIRRLFRHYKFNNINSNNNLINTNVIPLGFNYNNLRWTPLVSYTID